MFDQRLGLMESVFHNIDMAVILYDMFGRLIYINEIMINLIKKTKYQPYEMTAIELCLALTNESLEKIKRLFREIIFFHKTFSLSIKINDNNQSYILKIKPLIPDENKQIFEEANPFKIYGFLFEIIEITDMEKVNHFKLDFFKHIHFNISRHLQNIHIGLSMLMEKKATKVQKQISYTLIKKCTIDMFKLISEAPNLLNMNYSQSYYDNFPFIPSKILENSSKLLSELAQKKNVTFDTDIPEMANIVCTRPGLLEDIINIIIKALIEDAREGTKIKISLVETEDDAIINIQNNGFGMPNEDFYEYLFGKKEIKSRIYRELRKIIKEAT